MSRQRWDCCLVDGKIQEKGGLQAVSSNMRGKIKWFSERKGYGFISKDDGSGDVFVHYSSIMGDGFKTLKEGEVVEFEVTDSDKGPKAANVKKV